MKICCFSGHRIIAKQVQAALIDQLKMEIGTLVTQGYTWFVTGGALGFDTMAAQVVLHLREVYPQMKLALALPCRDQTANWHKEAIAEYERIKQDVDRIIYTAQYYEAGCMQKRNRYMVDHSQACICYLTRPRGGTAYTVHYAQDRGLAVINLANALETAHRELL